MQTVCGRLGWPRGLFPLCAARGPSCIEPGLTQSGTRATRTAQRRGADVAFSTFRPAHRPIKTIQFSKCRPNLWRTADASALYYSANSTRPRASPQPEQAFPFKSIRSSLDAPLGKFDFRASAMTTGYWIGLDTPHAATRYSSP